MREALLLVLLANGSALAWTALSQPCAIYSCAPRPSSPQAAPRMKLEGGEPCKEGYSFPLGRPVKLTRVKKEKRPPKRNIPFETARFSVQRLGLRTEEEWRLWCADQKPGITSKRSWHMPSKPDVAYSEQWQGWDDWLGVPLSFNEACAVVATLNVMSQEQWWAVAREQAALLQTLRVPARPHIYYAAEWQGYDHWLGRPETPLIFPQNYGKDSPSC